MHLLRLVEADETKPQISEAKIPASEQFGFGLVVAEMVFAPEPVGGAHDLGQGRGGLRFRRLPRRFGPLTRFLVLMKALVVSRRIATCSLVAAASGVGRLLCVILAHLVH